MRAASNPGHSSATRAGRGVRSRLARASAYLAPGVVPIPRLDDAVAATPESVPQMRTMLSVAAALASSLDRSDVQRAIVDGAARLTGATTVVLRRTCAAGLEVVEHAGLDDAVRAAVAAADRPASPAAAPTAAPTVGGGNDVTILSLRDGDRSMGELVLAPAVPAGDVDLIELLADLGTHAAVALRNAELFEQLDLRAAQMRVIQAASARMTRTRSVAGIGRIIVEEVAAIVEYHNARVYLIETDDELVPIAFEGRVGAYEVVDWDVLRVKVGEGFTGWVAASGTPLCIPDANADPRGVHIPGTDEVPESMLVVPMRHDDAVIGVITLSKLGLGQFDADDEQVLSILADQAGTALESARLLSRTEAMTEELRQLLEMSQDLANTLDSRQIGALLARHLTVALGVDACAISSWDVAADRVVSLGEFPDPASATTRPTYELAEYPETRRVLETQATVIIDVEDPAADPAEVAIMREDGDRLLAMIPLIAKGRSVGLVELMSASFVPFDDRRLALARTMANEAAMAVENARLYAEAKSLADRDPLTGFQNHRSLHERLGEEFVRSRRNRRPLSVLMLDVDDFKLVNDTFGHQFGDRCLVHLADVVRGTLRASDIPARYGGDEFAVILPDADEANASVVADRITAALAASPLVADGRGPVPIPVSIGIATLGPESRTPAELLGLADERMYEAKARADGGLDERRAAETTTAR